MQKGQWQNRLEVFGRGNVRRYESLSSDRDDANGVDLRSSSSGLLAGSTR